MLQHNQTMSTTHNQNISNGQYAHPEALVSTDWIAQHLNDPKVRFIESNEGHHGLDKRKDVCGHTSKLLLYPKNSVLCRFGNSEPDDGLSWDSDLLLRLGVETHPRFALLFHQSVRRTTELLLYFLVGLVEFGAHQKRYGIGVLFD